METCSSNLDVTIKRLIKFDQEGTVKAVCDVALGEQFLIKGFRVIDGRNGLFISMPRQQGKSGKWFDIASPLTPDAKLELSRVILAAYNQEQTNKTAST